jgi:hypothetical protein
LKQGCVLPSVTALQILLNRTRKHNKIQVDGTFGPNTRNAVIEFQRMKHISPDGIVGMKTWPLLSQQSGLKIIDSVDVTDPVMMDEIVPSLLLSGSKPIMAGAMCGGVSAVLSQIVGQAAQSGATVLLRLTGHGGPGGQYVTGGRVAWMPGKDGNWKKIDGYEIDGNIMKDSAGNTAAVRDKQGNWKNREGQIIAVDVHLGDEVAIVAKPMGKNVWVISPHNPRDTHGVEPALGKLRDIFVRFGSIELHGCSVGKGVKGHMLLKRLANILGVPVSAALGPQASQGAGCPFRFTGPVATAVPFGGNLKGWSKIVAKSE